jgi:DNA-binding MarR family transcriptional regulator
MIEAHPDIDQASLAGGIAYDPVTIGGVIARIEAKGWIIRRVDPADKRSRLLRIEPAGREVLKKMLVGVQKTQTELMKPLSVAERGVFTEMMKKLLEAHNDSLRVPLKPLETQALPAKAAKPARKTKTSP